MAETAAGTVAYPVITITSVSGFFCLAFSSTCMPSAFSIFKSVMTTSKAW
jgi:hypothetical protein